MKRDELIKRLIDIAGPDDEIMILDGFNGGGYPREINLGPTWHRITMDDTQNGDTEEMNIGSTVVVLGYGCY